MGVPPGLLLNLQMRNYTGPDTNPTRSSRPPIACGRRGGALHFITLMYWSRPSLQPWWPRRRTEPSVDTKALGRKAFGQDHPLPSSSALGSASQKVNNPAAGATVTDSPESVVRKFLACFPASDVDNVIGFFSDDAVYIDGPRGVHTGIDAIRTELQSQLAMVPNTTIDVKALAESQGTVLTERIDICEIAGQSVGMEIVGAFDVNSDGRITRWRDYYDLSTLMQQVTAATAKATADPSPAAPPNGRQNVT